MRRELAHCDGWVWSGANFARCPICRARRLRLGRFLLVSGAILGTLCATGVWAVIE
jgi:hypothetical protein